MKNKLKFEGLKKIAAERNAEIALVFGSYLTKGDKSRDIDLLLITDNLDGVNRQYEGKSIDFVCYTPQEFKEKVKHNDYLLASITENGECILGKEYFDKAIEQLLEEPDNKSIEFNKKQAVKYVDYGRMSHNISKYYARRDVEDNSDLKNIKEAVFSNYWFLPLQSGTKGYFTLGLGNYSTAHGFFRAAQIIEDEERLTTYNELIKTDNLLKNLRGIQGVGKDKKELDEEYIRDAMGLIREIEYEIKEM